jgi:leader peptidase (prepilin peptidase)/N-methyltransferase
MTVYFYIVFFIFGLIIGSFLNVVSLRLLKGENFIRGRSRCPVCNNLINWYDNIPIISFLILRGKCRSCGVAISIQYPVAEIVTGILFVLVYHLKGLSLDTFFTLILISNFVVLTITDIKEKFIFDLNTIPIIPLGLVYNFFDIGNVSHNTVKYFGISFQEIFISALLGAVIGAVFFEVFSNLGRIFTGEYAFGGGDTILGSGLGAWFGWKFLIVIIILGLFFQLIFGIPIIIANLYKSREYQSLYAMAGMFVALIMSLTGRAFTYSGHATLALIIILLSFMLTGISIFILFKRMRETKNYTFLPFGPPLVAGALVIVFFGEKISGLLSF